MELLAVSPILLNNNQQSKKTKVFKPLETDLENGLNMS